MTVNISETILNDLCSRFLVNLPKEELDDPVRVCFQIELAHWFYTDFYKTDKSDNPPRCTLRDFIRIIFNYLPNLKQYASSVDNIIDQWRKYKSAVPTYGAILLDEEAENVLLVQGYYATSRWGFPKGKVNEEEPPHLCAIREVREETGYDSSALLKPTVFLERPVSDTFVRLYIVAGVPKSFAFHPETRNEIKSIQWFPVQDLPTDKHDNSKNAIGVYANNFYGVIPFVNDLKEWIRIKKGLPPTTNDVMKKLFRSYSPNQHQNLIRSAGNFVKGNGANHGRNNRQRTQSLSAPLCLENGNDYNGYHQNSSTNGLRNNGHYGSNNANNITTPKFNKHQQHQQQFTKKQKSLAKTKLFTDESDEYSGETTKNSVAERVNGVVNETPKVGAIRLVQVWQDVQIDWNRILKDL